MTAKQFVKLVMGSHITGYYNYETNSNFQDERKMDWLKTGKRILKQLAKELGLAEGTYDVHINAGGVAVSGDIILHSDHYYVNLSQSCLGPDFGFYYRSCNGRKDYSGGRNQWSRWENLLDLPKLAGIIKIRAI
jgi:hypothetical protein